MAQSSDTMQEPGMDELLTSIREIIEENTHLPPSREESRVHDGGEKDDIYAHHHQAESDVGSSEIKQATRVVSGNSGVPPVQDAMNALAERIGLRKASALSNAQTGAHQTQHMASREGKYDGPGVSPPRGQPQHPGRPSDPRGQPQHPGRPSDPRGQPQHPGRPSDPRGQPQHPGRPSDAGQGGDEKGIHNDVERSAEILLRSYISQWLDEHFRQLFEKILREEVHRFIEALRR